MNPLLSSEIERAVPFGGQAGGTAEHHAVLQEPVGKVLEA
jgi:hypothetical protein